MSFEAFRDNAVARMESGWTATPVAYENAEFNAKPDLAAWIRMTIRFGQGETAGNSDGETVSVRDRGVIAFQLFEKKYTGTKVGMGLIDDLLELWEHSRFNGIRVYTATVTTVGDSGQGWHQTNITLPFRRYRNV